MAKRALLVGINEYDEADVDDLTGCVADAEAMANLLARHDDGTPNFECRLLTNPGPQRVTRAHLRQQWRELFHDFRGDVLFYFSGHGSPSELGGFLVTQEGSVGDPGLPMEDVVTLANQSVARTVLIILDCCYSGNAGNPAAIQGGLENRALLREGVTIIAASRPAQVAIEAGGHGVFTDLVLGALKGGAADVRGRVSAASIYAYAEAALGSWDSRPLYKSHAERLDPVRICRAKVPDPLLRELTTFFPNASDSFPLDMTYEETNGAAIPEHVAIFKKFKEYQVGGLLEPSVGRDLYWTAERSESVHLTDLGKFYHTLSRRNLI